MFEMHEKTLPTQLRDTLKLKLLQTLRCFQIAKSYCACELKTLTVGFQLALNRPKYIYTNLDSAKPRHFQYKPDPTKHCAKNFCNKMCTRLF